MNITILGCGAYGLALATMFQENNQNIFMWNKFQNEIESLKEKYPTIKFTTNLKEAIENSDLIVIAIPVAFLEETIKSLKNDYQHQDILIASKGIDTTTLKFAHEIITQYLNAPLGILSGGTFAADMIEKKVMGLTLATTEQRISQKVKNSLQNRYLKIQVTSDIIGTSICGAIKNVIAIGFGLLDGASYPESSRFLFLTEAIYEIQTLIKALGGDPKTIMTYAGIDDIMMTCTSAKSRNYTLGKMFGEKRPISEIKEYQNNTTIEGLGTSKAIFQLANQKNITLPLTTIIYQILYENKNYLALIQYLEEKES